MPSNASPQKTHTVPQSESGQRLDRYLKNRFPDLPFTGLHKLIRTGKIRLNGKKTAASTRLEAGDVLTLPSVHQPREDEKQAAIAPLTNADKKLLNESIVYEDDDLLVFNKPAGLAAQAGAGVTRSLDRLAAQLRVPAPKLTHRLDRETTGLLVMAKSRVSAANLTAQFSGRGIGKTYYALVAGNLPATAGEITSPLARRGARSVVATRAGAGTRTAHTSWSLIKTVSPGLHLLAATPHTGRLNQLRAHFASIGLPIVGDSKYGSLPSRAATRALHPAGGAPLYLHAYRLVITHPHTGHPLALSAPLPPHFQKIYP